MVKPKFNFNAVSGLGTKDSPLTYQGKKYTGTVQWSTGPAKYINGVKLTATTDTTIVPDGGAEVSTTAIPEPGVTVAGTAEVGPTGPTGPTGDTATGPTASVADTAKKFGIIEALLFDPKYGKPNEKGGLWEVFDVLTREKNPGKADDLFNATAWNKLDTDVQDRYLMRLENEPLYKEKRNEWLVAVKKFLTNNDIVADDATLFDYYDRGIEDTVILDELIGKQTGETGFGADERRQLGRIARDNGFDLDKDFSGELDGWLQRIARGENIDKFENIIRSRAAEGKPTYVQEQLKLGNDLRFIYREYLQEMAGAFNIDVNAIDINDPLLQKAFTDKGPIKFNAFKSLLRTDPRYGATPQAASEADLRTQILDRAVAIGANIAEEDINNIVSKLLSTGLGSFGQSTIDSELRKFIRYTSGAAVTGAAGNALNDLRSTATANGIDLDKTFGTSIQDWLQKIDQGESIETYKRLIRQAAKMGLPDNVKKMMDEGLDLSAVFNPYRQLMGKVLEISPDAIDLNDPTLRSAIGPDKEMTIYEFQKTLRRDPRWQYTDNAREDVSTVALQVLRDFGFQG